MNNIFFSQAQGSRKEQQDAYGSFIPDNETFIGHAGKLLIVADGMGGLAGGAEASKLTINAFIHAYKQKEAKETIPDALKRSAIHANKSVYDFSVSQGIEGNTGSTLVALVQLKQEIYWISVGDSRIYAVNDKKLDQLTRDHNYEQDLLELVKKGRLAIEDVENNKQKAALTSYIGSQEINKISQNTQPLNFSNYSAVFLCSDGFYSRMTETEIISLIHSKPHSEVANLCIKEKLKKNIKNQDNLTIGILFNNNKPKKSKALKMAFIWLSIILLPTFAILSLNYDLLEILNLKANSAQAPISSTNDSNNDAGDDLYSIEVIDAPKELITREEEKNLESDSTAADINAIDDPNLKLKSISESNEMNPGLDKEFPSNQGKPIDNQENQLPYTKEYSYSENKPKQIIKNSELDSMSGESLPNNQANKATAQESDPSIDGNVMPLVSKSDKNAQPSRQIEKNPSNDPKQTLSKDIADISSEQLNNLKNMKTESICRDVVVDLGYFGSTTEKVCEDVDINREKVNSLRDDIEDKNSRKEVKNCKEPNDNSTENRILPVCKNQEVIVTF